MLRTAAPTVATMTSYTAMHFIDGLMVSRIGPDPVYVAAQGNGGMAAWMPMSVVMGFLMVVNTFVSQNLGAGRPRRGAAYAWNGLWAAMLGWVLLLPCGAAAPWAFGLTGHSPRLLELESRYTQVLIAGACFTLCTRGIAQYFYGMHRPMTVLVAALVGNGVNVAANWVFIFGNLGAPAMGVAGAAVGTVVGSAVEFAIPMAVFLSPGVNRRYGTRGAWAPESGIVRDIFRVGWPGALMFGNEMVCWAYFSVYLAATFGEVHNTAGWITLRYMHVSFMPTVGLSIAVQAMVGKCMGMGRPDLAAARARLGLQVSIAYMGACALAFVLFRREMVGLFIKEGMPAAQTAELIAVGGRILVLAAVFQVFDAIATTLSGALRGAGDTVWPGVVTIVLAWVCIIGGGHLLVEYAPELKSVGPWIGAAAYIILLGLALLWRFARGRWRAIRLVPESAAADPPEAVSAA